MRGFEWHAPPWVIFADKGKPMAILPAGRMGEVADVSDMPARDVKRIVRLANQLHEAIFKAKMQSIERRVKALVPAQHKREGEST